MALVLTGCAANSSALPEVPEASPTPQGTPFQAHLGEYLDPAWTNQPVERPDRCSRAEDGELEGYVNGKLIVLYADGQGLLDPTWLGAGADVEPNEPGPPDWGLPWADSPGEVGTVVVVWDNRVEAASYLDGSKGYRVDWGVKLVDFRTKTVVGDAYFPGGAPPYTKSGPGDTTGDDPWADLFAALRARLFAAPFTSHLTDYLDPAWMSQPTEWTPGPMAGYINGGLVVVSADTGQLLRSSLEARYPAPDAPGPPDWGLPWADTPDEVGTVAIVWTIQEEESTYADGTSAYREDFMVRLVDFQTRTVISEGSFLGEMPPNSKSCSGDLITRQPWDRLMEDLRALPQR